MIVSDTVEITANKLPIAGLQGDHHQHNCHPTNWRQEALTTGLGFQPERELGFNNALY